MEKKKKATNCETCTNYVYDEDYDCYVCMINLDEDEMYRFLQAVSLRLQQFLHCLRVILLFLKNTLCRY